MARNTPYGPRTDNPIGTLSKLHELKLDPASHHSCAEPGQNVIGCRHWASCTMPYKGGVNGQHTPQNHGVLYISLSKRVKTMLLPCYRFFDHKPDKDAAKEVFEIVANEGESILLPETVEEPIPNSRPPRMRSRQVEVEREVPKHETAEDVMKDAVFDARVREHLRGKLQRDQLGGVLGVTPEEIDAARERVTRKKSSPQKEPAKT